MQAIAFIGFLSAVSGAIYVSISLWQVKKLRKENQKFSTYVKYKSFLKEKDNSCDSESFNVNSLPEFSQQCNYVLEKHTGGVL